MFKTTSANSESRDRRSVVHTKRNGAGLDPSTFDRSELERRRTELVAKKIAVEERLSTITAALAEVSRPGGRAASRLSVERMKADRVRFVAQLRDVERELAELKPAMAKARARDVRTFERVFVSIAREMLATAVYERLLIAAVHRAQSLAEDGEDA